MAGDDAPGRSMERRQARRGVRRLRHLRPPRGRRPRGARPPRAPAPRPGGRGHRRLRRRAVPPAQGHGPGGGHVQRESVIAGLPGFAAVGHTRYATTGGSWLRNVQPLFGDFAFGGLAIAHNGNLTNALGLRRRLVEEGSLFHSTTDTEVVVHLIAKSPKARSSAASPTRCASSRGPGRWWACSRAASSACATPWACARSCWAGSTTPTSWRPRPARSTSWAPSSCATSSPARWW